MIKKKTDEELNNNCFVKLSKSIRQVESEVDECLKTIISDRMSFSINEVSIDVTDEDDRPVVVFKTSVYEQKFDVSTGQKLLDYDTTKVDIYFPYEYFDVEDLVGYIVGYLDCKINDYNA